MYHLGNYRECLVYAKSAIAFQPNNVMLQLIQASDSKLVDSYAVLSIKETRNANFESEYEKATEAKKEAFQIFPENRLEVGTCNAKKGNIGLKFIKILILSSLDIAKRNKITTLLIFILVGLFIKAKGFNLLDLIYK